MKILGIETSCDETSAAVVENGVRVLSCVIASSVDMHTLTGGVVPEVAAREHLRQIIPVVEKALSDAKCTKEDIDAIAVTHTPGLIASLLVGINSAETLAYLWKKPLIKVNHIAGHIYANFLERETPIEFPLLVLTVSGGHNELILMKGHHQFETLGETLDDAAGEAFDKVARLLGLGYPGGPIISKLALKGDAKKYKMPKMHPNKQRPYDFSFSGLKSAVRRLVEELKKQHGDTLSEVVVADLCASFQEAVIEALTSRLMHAVENYDAKEVHLAGGVSANDRLREVMKEKLAGRLPLHFPAKKVFCTDNGAMIAGAAYFSV